MTARLTMTAPMPGFFFYNAERDGRQIVVALVEWDTTARRATLKHLRAERGAARVGRAVVEKVKSHAEVAGFTFEDLRQ